MRNLCLVPLFASIAAVPLASQTPLEREIRSRIARDTAIVAVAYYDPVTQDTLLIDGLRRYHAASTMKVPVLIELARRIDAGELDWDQTLAVRNEFQSIVDGSPFQLDPADDSDSTLYREEGQDVTIRRLARLMISRSSNLATNLLISRLDPARVNATAHALGADSILVLRGVEDGKAYEKGLNNTTTARDLARLLDAIARGQAASDAQTRAMLDHLLAQEFNAGIPAGVPAGVKVAHKTGEITALAHDGGIVFPPGRGPYVLVVLTQGFPERQEADRLIADLSRIVYTWATRRPEPHE
jgi:beta-lactamase class A